MPIDIAKLREPQPQTTKERVHAFLAQNPQQAFTAMEVGAAVMNANMLTENALSAFTLALLAHAALIGTGKTALDDVTAALKDLVADRLVQEARFQGQLWYGVRP